MGATHETHCSQQRDLQFQRKYKIKVDSCDQKDISAVGCRDIVDSLYGGNEPKVEQSTSVSNGETSIENLYSSTRDLKTGLREVIPVQNIVDEASVRIGKALNKSQHCKSVDAIEISFELLYEYSKEAFPLFSSLKVFPVIEKLQSSNGNEHKRNISIAYTHLKRHENCTCVDCVKVTIKPLPLLRRILQRLNHLCPSTTSLKANFRHRLSRRTPKFT